MAVRTSILAGLTAAAIGGTGSAAYFHKQSDTFRVELNQAQAQVRDEQTRNQDLSLAAAGVVSAVSTLQEALARDADHPQVVTPSTLEPGQTSPEPTLAQAKVESP